MRCDECGRPILNADWWKITNTPEAPTARSMRVLCWDCRQKAARTADVRNELRSAKSLEKSQETPHQVKSA